VLLGIAGGVGEGLGGQLWEGLARLIRLPVHRVVTESGDTPVGTTVRTGDGDLAALRQAPGNRDRATSLAQILLARSGADEEFRRALEHWWEQAEPIRASAGTGNVINTISGGSQYGPVVQGRDFSGISFGATPLAPPVPGSSDRGNTEYPVR
jgi:hypothetical protein